MNDRIFILGAGRAGRGIARALRAAGVRDVALHGRRPTDDDDVTSGPLPQPVADASIVLIAVRDAQIESALAELATAPLASSAAVLHTSGSVDPPGLRLLRTRGHPCGTFHPLVPIPGTVTAPARLRGSYIGIDGDPSAIDAAMRMADAVAARTVVIPAGGKARYHAAAVMAANFPTVLAAIAEELFMTAGLGSSDAQGAVRSLVDGVAANLHLQPAEAALTGPASRGDDATINAHIAALQDTPDVLAVYRVLTRAAAAIARSGAATTPLSDVSARPSASPGRLS
ncbi:MAG: hypothetical protein NVS9B3_14550 [Gemmatimonadaceae bacterium]